MSICFIVSLGSLITRAYYSFGLKSEISAPASLQKRVDAPVASCNHPQVLFQDDDRISGNYQMLELRHQPVDIRSMQTRRRFVKDGGSVPGAARAAAQLPILCASAMESILCSGERGPVDVGHFENPFLRVSDIALRTFENLLVDATLAMSGRPNFKREPERIAPRSRDELNSACTQVARHAQPSCGPRSQLPTLNLQSLAVPHPACSVPPGLQAVPELASSLAPRRHIDEVTGAAVERASLAVLGPMHRPLTTNIPKPNRAGSPRATYLRCSGRSPLLKFTSAANFRQASICTAQTFRS